MKAVIVDIKDKYAVALSRNGRFLKVRYADGMKVGFETELPCAKVFSFNAYARIASAAAAFVVVTGLSYGVYSYNTPYSYVNLDINPSVELTANVYDRIIGAKGLNEDGEKLLSHYGLNNKKLEEGIDGLIKGAVKDGYLKPESEDAVLITVSGNDDKKVDSLEKEIQGTAAQSLKDEGVSTELVVEKAAEDRRDEAKKLGITPGRLNLIEKLKEVNPDVNIGDLKDAPVKDIMKSIKESRKGTAGDKGGESKEQGREQQKGQGKAGAGNRNPGAGTGTGAAGTGAAGTSGTRNGRESGGRFGPGAGNKADDKAGDKTDKNDDKNHDGNRGDRAAGTEGTGRQEGAGRNGRDPGEREETLERPGGWMRPDDKQPGGTWINRPGNRDEKNKKEKEKDNGGNRSERDAKGSRGSGRR